MMQEDRSYSDSTRPQEASGDSHQPVTQPAAVTPAPPPATKDKPERTTGLRLLDTFLYGILANTSVFLLSIAATYLTNRGNATNAEGKLIYGKVGEFFHKRGNWMEKQFMKTGMGEESAKMSKMVFFSWFDGSLLAPLIKLAEDQRKPLAKRIDKALGTEPADDSLYDAEPKQSWGSVLGGRLATCAIVVPTAVLLDKKGLNEKLFYTYGKKLGEKVEEIPVVAKHLGQHDIAEIGRVSLFEAFYTSVCTAGLYFSSRLLAHTFGDKKKNTGKISAPKERPIVEHVLASPAPAALPTPANDIQQQSVAMTETEKPKEKILLPPEGIESKRVALPEQLAINH